MARCGERGARDAILNLVSIQSDADKVTPSTYRNDQLKMRRMWPRSRIRIRGKNGRVRRQPNPSQLIERPARKNALPCVLPLLNRILIRRRVLRQRLECVVRVDRPQIADDGVVGEIPAHGGVVHERGDAELREEGAIPNPGVKKDARAVNRPGGENDFALGDDSFERAVWGSVLNCVEDMLTLLQSRGEDAGDFGVDQDMKVLSHDKFRSQI